MESRKNSNESNPKLKLKYVILGLAFLVIIIFSSFSFWVYFTLKQNAFCFNGKEVSLGELGDVFGVLNALFSAFALLGVIISIYLQSKELSETRDEFIKQNETLSVQRFETTLFNLIDNHKSLWKWFSESPTHINEEKGDNQKLNELYYKVKEAVVLQKNIRDKKHAVIYPSQRDANPVYIKENLTPYLNIAEDLLFIVQFIGRMFTEQSLNDEKSSLLLYNRIVVNSIPKKELFLFSYYLLSYKNNLSSELKQFYTKTYFNKFDFYESEQLFPDLFLFERNANDYKLKEAVFLKLMGTEVTLLSNEEELTLREIKIREVYNNKDYPNEERVCYFVFYDKPIQLYQGKSATFKMNQLIDETWKLNRASKVDNLNYRNLKRVGLEFLIEHKNEEFRLLYELGLNIVSI